MRQVIQIARATKSVVLEDDVDKGALSGSARNYGGDGGTTGNMLQMLLTEMSDPTSEAIYVFTFNRVPDMPELLRPGRIDGLFRVDMPNGPTRQAILRNQIERTGLTVDSEELLAELANKHTEGWSGAEIAHVLVKEEVIATLAEGKEILTVARMIEMARTFTPMSKMTIFRDDLQAMDAATAQFRRIGNIPDSQPARHDEVAPQHPRPAQHQQQLTSPDNSSESAAFRFSAEGRLRFPGSLPDHTFDGDQSHVESECSQPQQR